LAEEMNSFYSQLEKMLEKQLTALKALVQSETELSLFYQQKGYQEHDPQSHCGKDLLHLGSLYHDQRVPFHTQLMNAVERFLGEVKTFRSKAIGDTLDSIKRHATFKNDLDT
jgi:hypothetical protein